jgi:Na+/H+-translocating membrane pyrophosphatase
LIVNPDVKKKKDEETDEKALRLNDNDTLLKTAKLDINSDQLEKLKKNSKKISDGANTFLFTEYLYLLIFVACFALLIFFFTEQKQWTAYTTIAFLLGSLTSMLCGWIGMKIATSTNWRVAYSA